MTRRILLAVTGLTPQIVTETLYALAVDRDPPWIPDEIRLVTTAEGAKRARLKLLDPASGQFHALRREYSLPPITFGPDQVRVITDAAGGPLADIRTPDDNTLAADALLAEVRTLCADPETELHVSIAGGRKTMGFFLGYALSLFGRRQDRLSHVLVNEPFETLPDFYFPPSSGRVLDLGARGVAHTDDARVMLAEIPFVRLRDGLPRHALEQGAPYAAMVAAAQESVTPPALCVRLAERRIECGGVAVVLPPALLAWYAWLAACRRDGTGDSGFVRASDTTAEAYLAIYERILGRHHSSVEQARKAYRNGFDRDVFEVRRSKINAVLSRQLSLAAGPYEIACRGAKPLTRYGLDLPRERIKLV